MLYGLLNRSAVSFIPSTDIPILSGRVILITGGNVGLGLETALQLSQHNPSRIYLACRNEQKALQAIATIHSQLPNAAIEYIQLDLTSFPAILSCARDFLERESRLDLLFLNAGIMATPAGTTEQGYEAQFGTNHVGHALLTKLLLPKMRKTAAESGADVRIVVLSSIGHLYTPWNGIEFAHLKTDMRGWDTFARYAQSKLANILFVKELARREPGIVAVAVHPGVVDTELYRTVFSWWFGLGRAFMLGNGLLASSVNEGAKGQLWAGTGGGVESGEYYTPVGVKGQGSAWSGDEELAKKLWDWTEEELKGWGP